MTVHFIGAGPGAADLLTVRAVRLLASSPVCVYAGTYLDAEVLAHCPPGATLVDSSRLDLDAITAALVAAHRAGQDVARLCSGDPSLYSAVAEQARRLDAAGVPWDVTPGVPAYAAAAARVGRELTVPEVAQTVILTRAQAASTAMPETESLPYLARSRATLVLHLAIRRTRELAETLTAAYGADCPVVVVANASRPDEVVLRGTLADVADAVEAHGLRQAAVILVGRALAAEGFVDSHLYGSRVRAEDRSLEPGGPPADDSSTIPDQVAERIRRIAPPGCSVLPGSLPVVSFGDFRAARVATLALNPSPLEFQDRRGRWLDGPHRRLASLRSLGVEDPRGLDDAAVAEVVRESNAYFAGPNWYRSWFHWLEALVTRSGLGSYVDGTACHLDLVQWATRPAQRHLSRDAWKTLVEQDRDFLEWQLQETPAPTVLVNGAGSLRWLTAAGVVPAWEAGELRFSTAAGASATLQIFTAEAGGKRFLGWNRPLAGAIPAEGRELLRDWVTATASR